MRRSHLELSTCIFLGAKICSEIIISIYNTGVMLTSSHQCSDTMESCGSEMIIKEPLPCSPSNIILDISLKSYRTGGRILATQLINHVQFSWILGQKGGTRYNLHITQSLSPVMMLYEQCYNMRGAGAPRAHKNSRTNLLRNLNGNIVIRGNGPPSSFFFLI